MIRIKNDKVIKTIQVNPVLQKGLDLFICAGKVRVVKFADNKDEDIFISCKHAIMKNDTAQWVYSKSTGRLAEFIPSADIKTKGLHRIIADESNISPDLINRIRMMNGEKIYFECYRRGTNSNGDDADLTGGILLDKNDYYCAKFDGDILRIYNPLDLVYK